MLFEGRKENGHNNARRFEGGVLQMKYVEILHQTAMCMLFVCCGCAPFETVTDEQFASQMVEFKQETLDYTYQALPGLRKQWGQTLGFYYG